MIVTIVKPDNLVIIDKIRKIIDLTNYELPNDFWALHWYENNGDIEYVGKNEIIDSLPEWTNAIITEHHRLTEEQQKQQDLEEKQAIYLQNGAERQRRVEQEQLAKQQQEQQVINNFVRSQM